MVHSWRFLALLAALIPARGDDLRSQPSSETVAGAGSSTTGLVGRTDSSTTTTPRLVGSSSGCGGQFSPDRTYTFTAPAAGSYRFHTTNSNFDTVVHVLDDACSGSELACNNDSAGSLQSSTTVALAAQRTVTVVVDGHGEAGDFELTVETAT